MRYRDRPSAERCIIPPALETPSVGIARDATPSTPRPYVLALARELRRAFDERDDMAFHGALDALLEATRLRRRS